MASGKFTREELEIIKQNPNVARATEKQIFYSESFKIHFVKEYTAGKTPTQVFREAGFDPKILGSKRIERASARWRESIAKSVR